MKRNRLKWGGWLAGLWALALILIPGTVSAETGDFAAVVAALHEQYVQRGVPPAAREDSCWLEADAMIRRVAMPSFLQDERLQKTDLDPFLEPIREAMGEPLGGLDPLVVLDTYGRSLGDWGRFSKLLKKVDWKGSPDWRDPAVKQAVRDTAVVIASDAGEEQFALSCRYRTKWTFDISAVWFPRSRKISLYLIGSSACPITGHTKSVTLGLRGTVSIQPGPPGERVYSVKLDDQPEFVCRGCVLTISGRWTERRSPSDGARVSLSNKLDLALKGVRATGRLTQDVVITTGVGAVTGGRLTYSLEGRLTPEGELDGTFEAVGDRRAMSWIDDPPQKLRGTWTGRVDSNGRAKGTVTLKGKAGSFPWEGEVQSDR